MGEEVEEVRKEWDELEGTTLFDEYGTARKAKNVKRGHSSYVCVCGLPAAVCSFARLARDRVRHCVNQQLAIEI
jgi:hypothetical protein